jgi:protein-L-isoaspartate O-methyltransferase
MFFDQYNRFYSTSQTGNWPVRLNSRYRAIIEGNVEHLKGRRVLDVASHDGRWSFAALKAECAHVTGIEAQQRLVEQANQTFQEYKVDPKRYRFVIADMFDQLPQERADTVLLLGIYYHVSRHVDLARLVSDTGAGVIILDTNIMPGNEGPTIRLFEERRSDQTTDLQNDQMTVVGHPSRAAIKLIFGQFGYSVKEIDWSDYPKDRTALYDYNAGSRSTFSLKR